MHAQGTRPEKIHKAQSLIIPFRATFKIIDNSELLVGRGNRQYNNCASFSSACDTFWYNLIAIVANCNRREENREEEDSRSPGTRWWSPISSLSLLKLTLIQFPSNLNRFLLFLFTSAWVLNVVVVQGVLFNRFDITVTFPARPPQSHPTKNALVTWSKYDSVTKAHHSPGE